MCLGNSFCFLNVVTNMMICLMPLPDANQCTPSRIAENNTDASDEMQELDLRCRKDCVSVCARTPSQKNDSRSLWRMHETPDL